MYLCGSTLKYKFPLVVCVGEHISFVKTFLKIVSPTLKGEEPNFFFASSPFTLRQTVPQRMILRRPFDLVTAPLFPFFQKQVFVVL